MCPSLVDLVLRKPRELQRKLLGASEGNANPRSLKGRGQAGETLPPAHRVQAPQVAAASSAFQQHAQGGRQTARSFCTFSVQRRTLLIPRMGGCSSTHTIPSNTHRGSCAQFNSALALSGIGSDPAGEALSPTACFPLQKQHTSSRSPGYPRILSHLPQSQSSHSPCAGLITGWSGSQKSGRCFTTTARLL